MDSINQTSASATTNSSIVDATASPSCPSHPHPHPRPHLRLHPRPHLRLYIIYQNHPILQHHYQKHHRHQRQGPRELRDRQQEPWNRSPLLLIAVHHQHQGGHPICRHAVAVTVTETLDLNAPETSIVGDTTLQTPHPNHQIMGKRIETTTSSPHLYPRTRRSLISSTSTTTTERPTTSSC